MKETFTYDDMNRLTGITLKRASGQDLHCAVTYDALGRMTSRQAVTAMNGVPQVTTVFSQPVFHSTKVHALSTAQTQGNLFPTSSQSIAYTGFDKVSKVKQSNDSLCYTYGYDRQRIRMEEYMGNTIHAKDYVGMCEYVTETDLSGTVAKSRTFITGPYGVFAVVEKRNGVETLHYILKDNLGSWTTITNSVGTVEQQLSYDAWGSRRDPDTWANYTSDDTYAQPMFDRGYTGHEHLSSFGLINMNGRMYDPVMSSFLSADRYVQNPMSAQGFNRYAYCMYNPLRYVDPTGWLSGGGGGYNSNGSLPQVMISGQAVFVLPEITIKPREFNYEFVFDPYPFADGGGDLQWNNANNEQTVGHVGCGGGSGNSTNHGLLSNMSPIVSYEGVVIGYKQQQWQHPKNRAQKAINQKKAYEIQKSLKSKGVSKHVKDIKLRKISNLKTISITSSLVNIGLEGVDVYYNQEINVSNCINIAVAGFGIVFWQVSAVYLVLDVSSFIITGKTIGQNVDEWCGEPLIDFKQ